MNNMISESKDNYSIDYTYNSGMLNENISSGVIPDLQMASVTPPNTAKSRLKRYAELIVCSIILPVILFIGCVTNLFRLLK